MKSQIKICLSFFILFYASISFAESECVKGFRQNHEDFVKRIQDLESRQSNVTYIGYGSGAALAGCAVVSVALGKGRLVLPCGVLFGPSTVFTAAYANATLPKQIEQLDDTNRIFLLYQQAKKNESQSPEMRELMKSLAVPPAREELVLKALVRLVEDGDLCSGSRPILDYDETKALLTREAYSDEPSTDVAQPAS